MIQYHLIRNEDGESNIVVFISGEAPQVAHESHPNFEAILLGAAQGDESILSLFDVAKTVEAKFQRLSERVTTQHGKLFLDGVEVNNALTEQVLRFLDMLGFEPGAVSRSLVVTPTCGLAGASTAYARAALQQTRAIAAHLS